MYLICINADYGTQPCNFLMKSSGSLCWTVLLLETSSLKIQNGKETAVSQDEMFQLIRMTDEKLIVNFSLNLSTINIQPLVIILFSVSRFHKHLKSVDTS